MSTGFGFTPANAPVDWDALRRYAAQVAERAYAPHSQLHVGAAGLVDDGRVVLGCNVENASYGVTLCAECGLVSALHATGGGRLMAVAVTDRDGEPLTPCGRCRQLIAEHGGSDCQVLGARGPVRLGELLPEPFELRG